MCHNPPNFLSLAVTLQKLAKLCNLTAIDKHSLFIFFFLSKAVKQIKIDVKSLDFVIVTIYTQSLTHQWLNSVYTNKSFTGDKEVCIHSKGLAQRYLHK